MQLHRDILSYLLFGVLTTAVNYLVYLSLYNGLGLSAVLSNVVAWIFAVAFAFLTNKPFVFQSHDWSLGTVVPELIKFLGTRIGSGLLETVIMFLTADILGWDGNVMKLATSIFVIILNYVGSKGLVFRKK